MPHPLYERHAATIERALAAIAERGHWNAYSESPSPRVYGEDAASSGKAAFDALLDKPFPLELPGTVGTVGGEISPFGVALGITYPKVDLDRLFEAIAVALPSWQKAGPEAWVGLCAEILSRINKQSFLFANAVMHTTGQAFMMAFQAGGPHAQDRGLEAIAYAWAEMKRIPAKAHWEKPQGTNEPLKMEKRFRIVPRGVGLVIGCCTFPTWNGFPGLFADLATGNAVVVKPHPAAILPLALTVKIAREVLAEAGFDPNVVTLVAHEAHDDVARRLPLRPEVKLVDFTGSAENGNWLEAHARQAQVYTEKSGVNQIVVAAGIADAVQKLLGDPARAVEILGAVVNWGVVERLEAARGIGEVVLDTQRIEHPLFPKATIRTPLIVKLDVADRSQYASEWFGPVAFVIATASTDESLTLAGDVASERGALTMSVYSRSEPVIERAIDAAERSGVALSINLTGGVYVNQSAAFSDFHGTGANPAANAALTDSAFVASRFRVVQHRRHV